MQFFFQHPVTFSSLGLNTIVIILVTRGTSYLCSTMLKMTDFKHLSSMQGYIYVHFNAKILCSWVERQFCKVNFRNFVFCLFFHKQLDFSLK